MVALPYPLRGDSRSVPVLRTQWMPAQHFAGRIHQQVHAGFVEDTPDITHHEYFCILLRSSSTA